MQQPFEFGYHAVRHLGGVARGDKSVICPKAASSTSRTAKSKKTTSRNSGRVEEIEGRPNDPECHRTAARIDMRPHVRRKIIFTMIGFNAVLAGTFTFFGCLGLQEVLVVTLRRPACHAFIAGSLGRPRQTM